LQHHIEGSKHEQDDQRETEEQNLRAMGTDWADVNANSLDEKSRAGHTGSIVLHLIVPYRSMATGEKSNN